MKVKKGAIINVIVSAGEEQIEMPDLREFEKTNIIKRLEAKNLNNYTIKEEYSDDVKVGYLIKQTPEAGTKVTKDTNIEIVVSKGPETKFVDIVDVTGKTVSEAKDALKGLDITVIEEVTNDKSEDGIVLRQSIAPTQIKEGTPIEIIVGKYEEPTIDVSYYGLYEGMELNEAMEILDRNKIKYKVIGSGDLVESFTKEIKASGTVELKAKKSTPPAAPENNNGNSTSNNVNNSNNGNNN